MTAQPSNPQPVRDWEFHVFWQPHEDRPGDPDVRAQLDYIKSECDRRGMIYIDKVVLEGVSGSVPGKRTDLDDLFQRKREADDYDVLVVQRYDRLTRGGSTHAAWIQHELAKLDVELFFPGEDSVDSQHASLIQSIKFEGARDFARSLSQRSTQGRGLALQEGRYAPFSKTPYGCWRLYLGPDDQPRFIVRSLGDGRQEKLALDRTTVIDTYGQIGGGSKGHYRKQKNEKLTLIPGDVDQQAVVREIMIDHWRHGHGGAYIADKLNRRGIKTVTGKGWSKRTVETIYENTDYAGLGICNVITNAIYHEVGQGSTPKPAKVSASTLANGRPPKRLRPPDEWLLIDLPEMEGFLPSDVEQKVLTEVPKLMTERYERSAKRSTKKRNNSRHKHSPYILTGKIESMQDGEKLVGTKVGKKGHEQRRYRNKSSRRKYMKGSPLNNSVDAEKVETAVVQLIVESLQDKELIRKVVLEMARQPEPDTDVETQIKQLENEKSELRSKIQHAFNNMSAAALEAIQTDMDRMSDRIETIEEEIQKLETQSHTQQIQPEELAEAVLQRFGHLHAEIKDAPVARLRQLIDAFVEKVVVDQETRDFEVYLRLPASLEGCLVDTSQSSTDHQTPSLEASPWELQSALKIPQSVPSLHQEFPQSLPSPHQRYLQLAEADCRYLKAAPNAPVHCDCRRRRRAA